MKTPDLQLYPRNSTVSLNMANVSSDLESIEWDLNNDGIIEAEGNSFNISIGSQFARRYPITATLYYADRSCVQFTSEVEAEHDPSCANPENNCVFRTLNLSPTTTVDEVAKIVVVLDTSASMIQSRQNFSQGLDHLIDTLENKKIQLQILTTNHIYNSVSDYVEVEESGLYFGHVGYKKIALGATTEVPISDFEYHQIGAGNVQPPVGTRFNTYASLTASAATNFFSPFVTVTMRHSYSPGQNFSEFKNNIRSAIANIPSTGDQFEKGICNAVAAMMDQSEQRFLKANDKVLFVFLSDENDSSTLANCYPMLRTNNVYNGLGYNYLFHNQSISYQANAIVNTDGTTRTEVISGKHMVTASPAELTGTAGQLCDQYAKDYVKSLIQKPGTLVTGFQSCFFEPSILSGNNSHFFLSPSLPPDSLCNPSGPFSYVDPYGTQRTAANALAAHQLFYKTYDTFCAFDYRIPVIQTFNGNQYDSLTIPVVEPALGATSTVDAFKKKADQLFGPAKYFVANIVVPDETTCPLGTNQSVGALFKDLHQAVGSQYSKVIPICRPTEYASSLQQLSASLQLAASNQIQIAIQAGESLHSLVAVRGAQTTTLVRNSDFELNGNTITFTNWTVLPADIYRLTLVSSSGAQN